MKMNILNKKNLDGLNSKMIKKVKVAFKYTQGFFKK